MLTAGLFKGLMVCSFGFDSSLDRPKKLNPITATNIAPNAMRGLTHLGHASDSAFNSVLA